jgi:MFS transporter, DHA1 family, tetracycline resistance protein
VSPFYSESFGASPAVVTLIGAAYSLMQFCFSPVWGRLSDRSGRRAVILTSIVFAMIGWLVLGFATSLWMIVVARMIAGFGNANLGTVQAVIADVTQPEERAKGMGLIGAAFGMGFLLGPIVGGLLNYYISPSVPAFVSAGLAALNWVLAYFLMPETRPAEARTASKGEHRSLFPFAAMKEAMTLQGVSALMVVGLVYSLGFSLMETAIQLYIERQFVSPDIMGTAIGHKEASKLSMIVLVTVGVIAVIVQGGLINRLRKKFGEQKLLVTGTFLVGVSFLLYALLPLAGGYGAVPFAVVFPITVLLSGGSGIFSPSWSSLLSKSAPADKQGMVMGVGQSIGALGRIFAPAMSGLLLQTFRGLPFLVAAVLTFAAMGVLLARPVRV